MVGDRLLQLRQWVEAQICSKEQGNTPLVSLEPVSGDASFRRYFRAQTANDAYIAVDAPPDKEDSGSFVRIAEHWYQLGIRVPKVIKADLRLGFMLLEDFGDRQLLPELLTMDATYASALDTLLAIQSIPPEALPAYDEPFLRCEMELFPEWFLSHLLELDTHPIFQELTRVFALLVGSAKAQVPVCVHRDYHSRNLMPLRDGGLGVIDFQDAVIGPVTYDLVSLLRDSYIDWPDDQVYQWVEDYRLQLLTTGFFVPDSARFKKDFDLMGMQRQLKVVGIFSRLYLRDGKSGYLKDIPRTFNYLLNSARRYSEFSSFAQQLESLKPLMAGHPKLGVYLTEDRATA